MVAGLRSIYAPVRTIWARHDFTLSVLDSKGKVHTYEGTARFMLLQAADRLAGRDAHGGEAQGEQRPRW